MKDPRTTPKQVAPTEDAARLAIDWADGHRSEYTPRYVRLRCACAGCVEEMTGRPLLDPRTVPEDVFPHAIDYVGRYALKFAFSDGHDTGIYPFELLRDICPCEGCAGQTGSAEKAGDGTG